MKAAQPSHPACVIQTQGIAASLGGNHQGCALGPATLRDSNQFNQFLKKSGIQLNWQAMLTPNQLLGVNPAIKKLCSEAACVCQEFIQQKQPFIFFSGEHAYAMGIWQGAIKALAQEGKTLGLIWIDAHMDAHTFHSSPSGNVHGMPVAALLGEGDEELGEIYNQGPIINPKNLAMLGVRSFEKAEKTLLDKLKVPVVFMKDVNSPESLKNYLRRLRDDLLQQADYFAISLDIDAIDPIDAPAVGVPESAGLSGQALSEALKQFKGDKRFLGMEISEFSPDFDKDNKTLQLISEMVSSVYAQN